MELEEIELSLNKDAHKNKNSLKYHLLGGVESESSKAFVVYLGDKTENIPSVESLIVKHVLPGSTIYYRLEKGQLDVNKLDNYYLISRSELRLCKQLWDDIRSNVAKKGLKQSLVESYISRYMFYRKYTDNTLHQLLHEISLAYPLTMIMTQNN